MRTGGSSPLDWTILRLLQKPEGARHRPPSRNSNTPFMVVLSAWSPCSTPSPASRDHLPNKGLHPNPYQRTCLLGSRAEAASCPPVIGHQKGSSIQSSRPSVALAASAPPAPPLTFPGLRPHGPAHGGLHHPQQRCSDPLRLLPSAWPAPSPAPSSTSALHSGRPQWPPCGQPCQPSPGSCGQQESPLPLLGGRLKSAGTGSGAPKTSLLSSASVTLGR